MTRSDQTTFDVGGLKLDRPFQIRRFGHFGYNCHDIEAMCRFYFEDLGLVISDRSDRLALGQPAEATADFTAVERVLHFGRAGTEHHQFVLMSSKLWSFVPAQTTRDSVNQITWQVGSIAEVMNAADYLDDYGPGTTMRVGRDMPGSNWHTYLYDADSFIHELYYGMEQVGWDLRSKPRAMWDTDIHRQAPTLPVAPESSEVDQAVQAGVDLAEGFSPAAGEPRHDVDGVLLPRPFKVVRIGPVSLYSDDLDEAIKFHVDVLGFQVRTHLKWQGHRGVQLGVGTDHHMMTLYDASLRDELGQPSDRDAMAMAFQLANYAQLRAAVTHLCERGAELVTVPPELVTGFSHVAHLRDPDGNLVQLYYSIQQVAPPSTTSAPLTDPDAWPDALDAPAMPYAGEQFLGPWS